MLSGGDWQARRKCEIFSIWTKGMADFLNLTPGGPVAKLTSLQMMGVSNAGSIVKSMETTRINVPAKGDSVF